jgi:hypothetical protein
MERGRKGGRSKISKDDPRVQMATIMSKNMNVIIGEICATLKISRASCSRYLGLQGRIKVGQIFFS